MSASNAITPSASTFGVTYSRHGESIELVFDAAKVVEVWDRLADQFCAPLVPDDYARLAKILDARKAKT